MSRSACRLVARLRTAFTPRSTSHSVSRSARAVGSISSKSSSMMEVHCMKVTFFANKYLKKVATTRARMRACSTARVSIRFRSFSAWVSSFCSFCTSSWSLFVYAFFRNRVLRACSRLRSRFLLARSSVECFWRFGLGMPRPLSTLCAWGLAAREWGSAIRSSFVWSMSCLARRISAKLSYIDTGACGAGSGVRSPRRTPPGLFAMRPPPLPLSLSLSLSSSLSLLSRRAPRRP
mmetsp:Transcript_33538/g.105955  ORF Transcript_33538/g.105955 Transcript_33538/m.105955 type:complete len:234 (+) Transcript_33538:1266-1967(+)